MAALEKWLDWLSDPKAYNLKARQEKEVTE